MTLSCRQKTRYVDGLLVPSHDAFYGDRRVVYDAPPAEPFEIHIDEIPDGAEIRILADRTNGTPQITRRLNAKATLGRKGRRQFASTVTQIQDPSERAAYLAVALGGIQGKLDKVGSYGSDVLRAVYAEAGVDTSGRTIVVDGGFPRQADYSALNSVADSSAVDPALRRAAMAVILKNPTFGYVATATGAEEAYQVDQMERDISRVQTETELAAAAMHDAWRAPRLLADGTYEPRLKDDGLRWSGGVDIANTAYADLPERWQRENRLAAAAVVHAIETDPSADIEALADAVHQDWLTRNSEWAEPTQLLPYAELPEAEQQKDREVVLTTLAARTAAAVETTRAWVTTEDMCFFDGRAGFNQTRELATVALDTNLPIDVREAAADRVLTSPYSGTGDMTIPSEIRAAVPSDDPVLISLAARLDERDRLQRERMHRIRTTPAIPAPRAPTHTSGGPSNGAQFTFKIADVEYGVPAANASSALAQAHALAESEGVTVTVSSAQDTLAVCKPTHTSGGPSNGAQFL